MIHGDLEGLWRSGWKGKDMLYPVMDKSNFIQVDSVMGQVSSLLFTQLTTSKTQIEI